MKILNYFSKIKVLSFEILTCEQLRQPVTITVSPGDRTIVFCTIYDPVTYKSIGVSWDGHRELNWQALGQKVSQKVNQSNHCIHDPVKIPASVTTAELHETLIAQTDTYLAQLNWTQEVGKLFLHQRHGKRSPTQLTDAELLDFIDYLKLQPKV